MQLSTGVEDVTLSQLSPSPHTDFSGILPIVSPTGLLVALASWDCLSEARSYPAPGAATVDSEGRLRCGAAVGTRESDKARVAKLYEIGHVDAIILDSSQGDSTYQAGCDQKHECNAVSTGCLC